MTEIPLLSNGSFCITADNYTTPANLTIQIVSNGKEFWYIPLISSLLGVIAGAVLMFLFNILHSKLQERTELERYEYTLLSIAKDLLDRPLDDKTEEEIKDFVGKTHPDLRFSKIRSYNLITDALLKAMSVENNSEEKTEIDNRIKKIRKSAKRRIL